MVTELLKTFRAFYGTRTFIMFTAASHWSLSWTRLIQSTSCYFTAHYNSILPPMLRSSKWLVSFRFCHRNPVCIPVLSSECYMFCPSRIPLFDHPDNFSGRARILMPFVTQNSGYIWLETYFRGFYYEMHIVNSWWESLAWMHLFVYVCISACLTYETINLIPSKFCIESLNFKLLGEFNFNSFRSLYFTCSWNKILSLFSKAAHCRRNWCLI
jgi:hypothetical protein